MRNRCNLSLSLGFAALFFSSLNWAQGLPFTANEGITGSWFDVTSSGQGFIFELIPTQANTLAVFWFTYDPSPSQTFKNSSLEFTTDHFWLTGTGTLIDNSVDITFNLVTGGTFDVGGGISNNNGWATANITFNSCSSADFSYNLPAAAGPASILVDGQTPLRSGQVPMRAGNIALTRLTPDNTCDTGGILPLDENWAGTFEGFWHNNTFDTTGSAKIVVTYDPVTGEYDVTEDYGGNVFGTIDPDPVHSTVKETGFGKEESVIVNDPVYGDCTTEYTDAGRFRGTCTPPQFEAINYEGVESTSHMKWTYEIIQDGQVFADGTVIVWRTK